MMFILLKPLVLCLWLFLHCALLRQVSKNGSKMEELAIFGMVGFVIICAIICYAWVTYYIYLFLR